MRLLAPLLVCLLGQTACFSTAPSEAALGEEFELAPNQSTRVAGTELTVGFRRVVADNRCPLDAACVTEGKAGIELNVFGRTGSGPVLVSDPLPAAWNDGVYQVRLIDLLPHPTTGKTIGPNDYRLRLQVVLLAQ